MQAKREYRDRPETQVAVLDVLVERAEEGMTVFELRSAVGVGIDPLEEALAELKSAGLIHVDSSGDAVRITPADRVIPEQSDDVTPRDGFLGAIRDRLGL